MQRDWMSFEVCPVSWVPLDPDGRWWHVVLLPGADVDAVKCLG